jgi:hypothetical protein
LGTEFASCKPGDISIATSRSSIVIGSLLPELRTLKTSLFGQSDQTA